MNNLESTKDFRGYFLVMIFPENAYNYLLVFVVVGKA
jgi:hypothetical protein